MIWGLSTSGSSRTDGAAQVQTFEDLVRSIAILSGNFSADLVESRTLLAINALGTTADSGEVSEKTIDADRVDQLLLFLFDTFLRYGSELYASQQLKFPDSQAAPGYGAVESTLLFRGTRLRPTWEVAKEFDRTFPRWLELLLQYFSREVVMAPAEPRQMIPLLDVPPQTLSATSLFHLTLAIGASKDGHAPRWDRLYLASTDGFSMNRFETKVFKYFGPTVTLVRGVVESTHEVLVAVYTEDAWQKSKLAWGGKSTRVFEVEPYFEPFLPSRDGVGLICYNHTCGLGVGPTAQAKTLSPEAYLFRVDASFQTAYYTGWLLYPERPTFQPSRLRTAPPPPFGSGEAVTIEVVEIEVFGLGGFEALTRQKAEWQFEASDAERRASLTALTNPKDPTSRQLLEMAGIVSEDTSIYRARSSN